MYRRPKFQEVLLKIRQDMSREADYDVDLFAEMIRSGRFSKDENAYEINGNQTSGEKDKIENPKSKI